MIKLLFIFTQTPFQLARNYNYCNFGNILVIRIGTHLPPQCSPSKYSTRIAIMAIWRYIITKEKEMKNTSISRDTLKLGKRELGIRVDHY